MRSRTHRARRVSSTSVRYRISSGLSSAGRLSAGRCPASVSSGVRLSRSRSTRRWIRPGRGGHGRRSPTEDLTRSGLGVGWLSASPRLGGTPRAPGRLLAVRRRRRPWPWPNRVAVRRSGRRLLRSPRRRRCGCRCPPLVRLEGAAPIHSMIGGTDLQR
jgi:hypothetical protein